MPHTATHSHPSNSNPSGRLARRSADPDAPLFAYGSLQFPDVLEVLLGARVVDLYAGSGALGLEAASRGAATALLVESDKGAAKVTQQNAGALGIPGITVRHATVQRVLATGPAEPQTLVFLDPPYPTAGDEVDGNLEQLSGEWVVPGGMVVVERSSRSRAPQWPPWFAETRERKYGETTLWYGHAAHPR